MCMALGGRAAEDVIYGKVSTGALSDLEKVTKQAYAMVTMYGLNERVGNISFYDSTGQSEYTFGKPYSEQTAQAIDEEVSKIVEGQYQRAKRILAENKDKLSALATQLLEKEVIFKEDLEKIFLVEASEIDPAKRKAHWVRIQEVLMDELPVIPMWEYANMQATSAKVVNVVTSAVTGYLSQARDEAYLVAGR